MSATGGHWHVRIQVFCNREERAREVAKGLRANGLEGVRVESSVVAFTRNTPDRYAEDPMSAAFHAMQMLWDRWPESLPRPSSRFTVSVNYKAPVDS